MLLWYLVLHLLCLSSHLVVYVYHILCQLRCVYIILVHCVKKVVCVYHFSLYIECTRYVLYKSSGCILFRALQPSGWSRDWHCGVRVAKSGKLVGFISAVPALIKMYDK